VFLDQTILCNYLEDYKNYEESVLGMKYAFFSPVTLKKGTLKTGTHVCIHIKCHNCPVLTKTGIGQHIVVTVPNIKLHEFCRVTTYGQTDKHGEANRGNFLM
jgi:hypothetical protein